MRAFCCVIDVSIRREHIGRSGRSGGLDMALSGHSAPQKPLGASIAK
jgi:hypothetical protein